eukprot:358618-Chlamydomonas_euryale.AAC.2
MSEGGMMVDGAVAAICGRGTLLSGVRVGGGRRLGPVDIATGSDSGRFGFAPRDASPISQIARHSARLRGHKRRAARDALAISSAPEHRRFLPSPPRPLDDDDDDNQDVGHDCPHVRQGWRLRAQGAARESPPLVALPPSLPMPTAA